MDGSALVGAVSYLTRPKSRADAPGIARYVSRYARGDDYHDVLRERLGKWGDAVREVVGGETRTAQLVDTSAVLERELAVRAGLGWFGKNTCMIGPEGDSWRFIGVLLTDADLAENADPLTERCGSCRACLDACPTGAITEPWFVDSNRCISYLTIEHRDAFPEELEPLVGDWLFGCDVCQEVCPWNRKVSVTDSDEFGVGESLVATDLVELASMSEEEFRRRFRGTPLTRPKRAGMVRNALVVGANARLPEIDSIARRLVDDPDPRVAKTAARIVKRLDP